MDKLTKDTVQVPLSIPPEYKEQYITNFLKATHSTGRLMLFAGDQKVEHLNDDYVGAGISEEDSRPEHMFSIASQARIGVFATQLGLISKHGADYANVPYLVKLNSKSHLVAKEQRDPLSNRLWSVGDVLAFKGSSELNILGIGYTIYLGSEFEHIMLEQAAQAIFQAHSHGLLSVIWMYPRGRAVPNEKDAHLIAGAAGVAAALGADFVKVNPPKGDTQSAELIQEAVDAAGNTGIICTGGSSEDPKVFLEKLYNQIHTGGTRGNATGRNIHQRKLEDAIKLCNAISAITLDDTTLEQALKILNA